MSPDAMRFQVVSAAAVDDAVTVGIAMIVVAAYSRARRTDSQTELRP